MDRTERAVAKGALASELATTGAAIAGLPGAAVGGLVGLIVGDETIVLKMDYIAVPAFEYSALRNGIPPSHTILLKEGEVITQVQMTEAEESEAIILESKPQKKKRKKLNSWQRFLKTFQYRKRRKNESGTDYGAARMKAASRAFKKVKR